MTGLKDSEILEMRNIFKQFKAVKKVILFGSRAKGNFKSGSDVDICLIGDNIDFDTLIRVNSILNEETFMPYNFDVVNYNDIKNLNLKKHIDMVGKCIYTNELAITM